MKTLIDIAKKIEKILFLLEIVLKKEYNFLLNVNHNNIHMLELIIKEKEQLFKKFSILNQEKFCFEKKNSILIPYRDQKLHYYFLQITKKCTVLKKLNQNNKILMNKNFYLNQHFLEFFELNKTMIIYDSNGNVK